MSSLSIFPTDVLASYKNSADWVGLRFVREKTSQHAVRNELPEGNSTFLDEGVMVEVLVEGHFGHAATADTSAEGIRRAFERAIATTKSASRHKAFAFTTAQRPKAVGAYKSPFIKSLDQTTLGEITDTLLAASRAMKISAEVVSRTAYAMVIQTEIDFVSTSGSETRQNFSMVNVSFSATASEGPESQTRSYLRSGQLGGEVFNREVLTREAERVGREALILLRAENCPKERRDLLLMPDQMNLQIHESIGHPLEMDRILGDERNYAGWSFVTPQDFGKLKYGSSLMNVSFDPTISGELASYAFDDCGNTATKEFLIKDGTLLRGLGSLESQVRLGLNGVANYRSSSWNRAPIDRMANINLEPGSSTLEEMISQIKKGVLMMTNRSWSIDDYRNKFQFGCEFGQLIEDGRITKIVKNPNYRGTTVDFWNRLGAVGRAGLSEIHGSSYCGKGEPSQLIRVGHASPPCLFREVEVFGGES